MPEAVYFSLDFCKRNVYDRLNARGFVHRTLVDPVCLCLSLNELQTAFKASVTYLHFVKQWKVKLMTSRRRDWLGSQTSEC